MKNTLSEEEIMDKGLLEDMELCLRDELKDLLSRTMLTKTLQEERELNHRIELKKGELYRCLEILSKLCVGEVS